MCDGFSSSSWFSNALTLIRWIDNDNNGLFCVQCAQRMDNVLLVFDAATVCCFWDVFCSLWQCTCTQTLVCVCCLFGVRDLFFLSFEMIENWQSKWCFCLKLQGKYTAAQWFFVDILLLFSADLSLVYSEPNRIHCGCWGFVLVVLKLPQISFVALNEEIRHFKQK